MRGRSDAYALFVRLCHDPLFGGERCFVVKLDHFGGLGFSETLRPLGDGCRLERPPFWGAGPCFVSVGLGLDCLQCWLGVGVRGAVVGGGVPCRWLRMSFTDPS